MESIKSYGFKGCHNLTSVKWPGAAPFIFDHVFYECTNLESIIIPDTVYYIDSYAFWNCVKLTEIELPPYIKKIDKSAFVGCSSLSSVFFLGTNSPSFTDDIFAMTQVSVVKVTPNYLDEKFCYYSVVVVSQATESGDEKSEIS